MYIAAKLLRICPNTIIVDNLGRGYYVVITSSKENAYRAGSQVLCLRWIKKKKEKKNAKKKKNILQKLTLQEYSSLGTMVLFIRTGYNRYGYHNRIVPLYSLPPAPSPSSLHQLYTLDASFT